jgi:hypothetical protein
MSEIPTLAYNLANSVIRKNAIIMNIIPSLRKMELSFVIWIIVLDSGYIAFPVAKVFLAVLINWLNK